MTFFGCLCGLSDLYPKVYDYRKIKEIDGFSKRILNEYLKKNYNFKTIVSFTRNDSRRKQLYVLRGGEKTKNKLLKLCVNENIKIIKSSSTTITIELCEFNYEL